MDEPRLTVELVPKPLWGKNLRSILPPARWAELRCHCLDVANHRCAGCGAPGNHCHEVWEYDDIMFVQRLRTLACLCSRCHDVVHLGHAQLEGRGEQAFRTLMAVNEWDSFQANEHIKWAAGKWRWRNKHRWSQDISNVVVTP